MFTKTVQKASDARAGKSLPTEGGRPSRKTNADIGAITKGSSGRPKAALARSDNRAGMHRTRANQATSTHVPRKAVPKDFLSKLGEMHTGEKELALALPLVAKAARSKDLKKLVEIHLQETKGHVKAIETAAKSLGEKLPKKSCKPITQLIKEAVKVMATNLGSSEMDPALIGVARKIEQFEIASYTPLCSRAKEMDYTHELALLTSVLNQEKLANELLGALGQGKGPLGKLIEKTSLKKVVAAAG